MDEDGVLRVPTGAADEANAIPVINNLARLIASLAGQDGLQSPKKLDLALLASKDIGSIIKETTLMRVYCLRALSAPELLDNVLSDLDGQAAIYSAPERAAILRSLSELITAQATVNRSVGAKIASILEIPLPDQLRGMEPSGISEAIGNFASRAVRLIRTEPPIISIARQFGQVLGEDNLLLSVVDAQKSGDLSRLAIALQAALLNVQSRAEVVVRAAEEQYKALYIAEELEFAARSIEEVATQRYSSIIRRAIMLKRQLREDLYALSEDAAEEFEADFRRLSENTGWFGRLDSSNMNDRLVIKNLERRYQRLARRYQDQLDLLDREISEYTAEFTRISDEALRPIARHEFREMAPHPVLELRVKAAVDRATTRTVAAGAAGAVASGAAVQAGLLSGAAILGAAATPVGMVILGAVAVAGVWKMFATPAERKKRDVRQRSKELEDNLRNEILSNLPFFEKAVDLVVARFTSQAIPDISRPRIEAERIREIASMQKDLAAAVMQSAVARIEKAAAAIHELNS